MTSCTRDALFEVFAELGHLYPEMRFGQLAELVALMATQQDGPTLVQDAEDQALLVAGQAHLANHSPRTVSGEDHGTSPVRGQLLLALGDVCRLRSSMSVGRIVAEFAQRAGPAGYDVEDEELFTVLDAYVKHIEGLFDMEEVKRALAEGGQGHTWEEVKRHLESLGGALGES